MKVVPIFLLVTIGICGYSATAFLINSVPLPVDKVLPLPLDNLIPLFDPLKMLLKTLGISVEHLVEGLKKCVNELGPEASEAVKKLLVIIICSYFHGRSLYYLNNLPSLLSVLFLLHWLHS
ncbi:pneumo secretory protein 1, isoform CRA_a [Rattus norvegicus]|uniref:Pneumo secretory protein 1, isoform CRA_a n=1 Tax=Rattus norvegicus TaxID=10116 RepID=A6KUD4_RAT|nr:pneumo secretory protein 1, isoform CRA_a [Rattus norvegicus]